MAKIFNKTVNKSNKLSIVINITNNYKFTEIIRNNKKRPKN